MAEPLVLFVLVACLAVAVILLLGISGFGRGGEEAGKRSNKYMRWRIYAQALAVVVILLFVLARGSGG